MSSIFVVWALVNPYLFTFTESDESAIHAFQQKGMEISFGDYMYHDNNLHYARLGDTSKPVLLFVHGSPGSWVNSWDYFMDSSWQRRYELISVDRPGFGKSDYGNAKNLFDQAEIIGAFVKNKLAGRRIHLVGHSYGGPLVVQLCADQDNLYDKCIIMAGSISPAAEKKEWQLNLFSKKLTKWMVPGSFEQGVMELLWLKKDLASKKYLEGIKKIKTPIIAIYGTKDNMVPYEPNVAFLQEHFKVPQLDLHRIEGAGHFLPWENYKQMKEMLLK